MQQHQNIIDCYNKTAKIYADKFINELNHKHLDRILLKCFVDENINKGKLIDLGCGPGQTTKFIADQELTDIVGIDISDEMINVARSINPHLQFETGDILRLGYPDNTFGSAVAFYSIVHFTHEQVRSAFKEVKRVLKEDGQFLFSFHVGEDVVHLDEFLEHKVSIDFYFFDTVKVIELATEMGFEIIDVIERQPYKDVEYPSRRAYVWVKKSK
ncbi:MAG TPA: class I SAM-dependent methyltransferase [Chitinophagaceae bacterium]|nr:class I SAM-dependent methyltransferase [Chitinophagaceae bacterium]